VREPEWTILKLLRWTTSYFESRAVDSPRATAEILLAHALGVGRIDLYLRYDQPMFSRELGEFRSLIKRRANHEPVAYIVGSKEFWSMELAVNGSVLIPRPETELLVECALAKLKQQESPDLHRIIDIGTGSGAVILAIASETSGYALFASDRSPAAIRTARENARRHGLDRAVGFLNADLLSAFRDGKTMFHMILSNPPYVPTRDLDHLQPEISRFEPRSALDGSSDGLLYIRRMIKEAHRYLQTGGYLLLEIGYDQPGKVAHMIQETTHYEDVQFTKDYNGHDRVVSMRKRAK